MELTHLAITTVLTTLATYYLQYSPLYTNSQRVWGEWAAWGAITLACRYRSHRSATTSDDSDKEAQSQPEWGRKHLEKPATVLALLFVASFCLSIRFSDEKLHWTYVSFGRPYALLLLLIVLAACDHIHFFPSLFQWSL